LKGSHHATTWGQLVAKRQKEKNHSPMKNRKARSAKTLYAPGMEGNKSGGAVRVTGS